jgi:hypothetical protein
VSEAYFIPQPRPKHAGDPDAIASGLSRPERIFLVQREDPIQVTTPYAKRHLHVTVFRSLIRKQLITWREIDFAYAEFLRDTFGDPSVSAYWVGLSDFGYEVRTRLLATQRTWVETYVRKMLDEHTGTIRALDAAQSVQMFVLGKGIVCRRIAAPALSVIYLDAEEADLFISVHHDAELCVTSITVRPCISTRRAQTFTKKG